MSADLLEVYLAVRYTATVGANYSCRQACLYWYVASRAARKPMRKFVYASSVGAKENWVVADQPVRVSGPTRRY